MTEPEDAHVAAVAALDEPTRRRLYQHVVRQGGPVSRDDAATAVDLPRSTAAFHLDRLADEGLLEVVYERRTGRTGPGAGRPSKLYRRADREVTVSLPGRRYDLAGELLADALEEAEASGASPREALQRRAQEEGRRLGAGARAAADTGAGVPQVVADVLEAQGFEPRAESPGSSGSSESSEASEPSEPSGPDVLVLGNCPFHALAEQHTALVCGMNLHLLDGLVDGLAGEPGADRERTPLRARLDPAPGRCCVVLDGEWSEVELP
jgi:predicted ArsR family transcriptional regulator